MKQMQIVSPNYIHQIWDMIEMFLNTAIVAGLDDYNVDQLKMLLIEGRQTLFVFIEDEKIIGALAAEVISYPNNRVVHTSVLGGKDVFDENTIKQYEDWARSQGATKIRAFAKDAQARLYRMKMGFDIVTNVVEKNI